MLGIGPDGHCASLFPGTRPGDTDAIAVAVHDSPKPRRTGVSLTFEAMQHSRAVWFIASGEGKAEAVARALADEGRSRGPPPAAYAARRRVVARRGRRLRPLTERAPPRGIVPSRR